MVSEIIFVAAMSKSRIDPLENPHAILHDAIRHNQKKRRQEQRDIGMHQTKRGGEEATRKHNRALQEWNKLYRREHGIGRQSNSEAKGGMLHTLGSQGGTLHTGACRLGH